MTTVLFTEGFDLYIGSPAYTATTEGDWTLITGAASYGVTGRFAGLCIGANGFEMVSPPFAAQSALSVGFAYQVTATPTVGPGIIGYILSGGNSNTTNRQLAIQLTAAKLLQVTNGTTTWSSTQTLTVGNWYYIELIIHSFSTTTGSFDLYCEGVNVLSMTNVNTAAASGAPATADRFDLSAPTMGVSHQFDDLYIADGLLGPCRIDTLRPATDSAVTWTRNTGSTNASAVNETQVNNDTTYVSDATVGDQDLYTIGALPITPTTIFAVTQRYVARKDDAALRQVAALVKSSSTTSQDTTQTVNSTYATFRRCLNTDPNGSIAWAAAAVNALLVGQKVIA